MYHNLVKNISSSGFGCFPNSLSMILSNEFKILTYIYIYIYRYSRIRGGMRGTIGYIALPTRLVCNVICNFDFLFNAIHHDMMFFNLLLFCDVTTYASL